MCQLTATAERHRTDRPENGRQHDVSQLLASGEGRLTDCEETRRKNGRLKIRVILKCLVSDSNDISLRQVNTPEALRLARKSRGSDDGRTLGR